MRGRRARARRTGPAARRRGASWHRERGGRLGLPGEASNMLLLLLDQSSTIYRVYNPLGFLNDKTNKAKTGNYWAFRPATQM